MTIPTLPVTGRTSPVERVMNRLITAGFVVGADWDTATVTVASQPVSGDTAAHWLLAINAVGWVRDDTTMRGTTPDGVTVVIPTRRPTLAYDVAEVTA